jgi:hypothetical protein
MSKCNVAEGGKCVRATAWHVSVGVVFGCNPTMRRSAFQFLGRGFEFQCNVIPWISHDRVLPKRIFKRIDHSRPDRKCTRLSDDVATSAVPPNSQHQPRTRQAANLRMQI